MRKPIALFSSAIIAFILAGCKDGVSVATFIDSPVSGLEFNSKTQSGISDANGNFIYKKGEKVTFHIGNLYFGSAEPKDGKITPLNLVGTNNISDKRVVRILQTLQTLDSDGNPANGITIDPVMITTLSKLPKLDLTKSSTTDAAVLAMIGKTAYSVDARKAQSNFTLNAVSNKDKGYKAPTTTSTTSSGNGKYTLVAWNDLGMHCVDGKDYSVFSILPPYKPISGHGYYPCSEGLQHRIKG